MRMAMDYCMAEGYDGVIVIDASGKTPTKIKGFGGLFAVLRQLFDVCRGSYSSSKE